MKPAEFSDSELRVHIGTLQEKFARLKNPHSAAARSIQRMIRTYKNRLAAKSSRDTRATLVKNTFAENEKLREENIRLAMEVKHLKAVCRAIIPMDEQTGLDLDHAAALVDTMDTVYWDSDPLAASPASTVVQVKMELE